MSRLRAGLGLPVALAAAVAVAGCGTQKLDVAEVEVAIGKRLTRNAKEKVTVTCPDEVEIKKGDRFDCKAKGKKDETTVRVTQLDDEGRVRGVVRAR